MAHDRLLYRPIYKLPTEGVLEFLNKPPWLCYSDLAYLQKKYSIRFATTGYKHLLIRRQIIIIMPNWPEINAQHHSFTKLGLTSLAKFNRFGNCRLIYTCFYMHLNHLMLLTEGTLTTWAPDNVLQKSVLRCHQTSFSPVHSVVRRCRSGLQALWKLVAKVK